MSQGNIAADQLRLFIERIERLEEEKMGRPPGAGGMIDAPFLVEMLRRARFPVSTEAALQDCIWFLLRGLMAERCHREHRLAPGERIDFFVDGTGIEAKTKCNKRDIYRQLQRYAKHDEIDALILVTGTALGLPREINGKPVFYVSLGRAAL